MIKPFTITEPLPTGTTVLEASAGTGKTYAIAALAARFIAEGRAGIGDLLVITFSRAATAELRSRVRERIRSTGLALAGFLGGAAADGDDVDRFLMTGHRADVEARAERLADALQRFDQATIMTTHEFCHSMMRGLGILAPQQPQSVLMDDVLRLADEASADVYVRRYAQRPYQPPFPWLSDADGADPGARSLGRDAVSTLAELGPRDPAPAAAERVAFADEVRAEVERRKASRRLYTFDDQLTRLRDALLDETTGALARARLAHRFPVVLVDEFQDTDPVQWQVLRSAFGASEKSTLVLIGDPKQAIYAFRGGDVHTYSAAAEAADGRLTLTRNYRADAHVVDAVTALFSGLLLGRRIDVPFVTAALESRRLHAEPASPWRAGVQLREVRFDDPAPTWQATQRISSDLVNVVTSLLSADSPLVHEAGGPPRASDIAVLVRSNARGAALASALSAAGIPATFSGTDSVFASPVASDWLTLLQAFDQPRRPFVQRAFLTDFVGASVTDLALADDARRASWSAWLHGWARTLRHAGFPSLVAAIEADTRLTVRLLQRDQGERFVTDHRHLAELLHAEHRRGGSLRSVVDWLASAIEEATASSERTRRLETDDAAVNIMTIHRAKGLQFPIVLLPEASRDYLGASDQGRALVLPTDDGRQIDVGGRGDPGRPARWRHQLIEDADESLRALYVGMTRAQSHVIAWWANHRGVSTSPLHRLLHAQRGDEAVRPELSYDTASEVLGGAPSMLAWLAKAGVSVAEVPEPGERPRTVRAATAQALRTREWTRTIDDQWRRTSYTGLTAAAHGHEPPPGVVADEPNDDGVVQADEALTMPSPMALLPGGAAFGTLVHTIYETVDARGPDWRANLKTHVDAGLRRWPMPGVSSEALTDALAPTLETPLGPLAQGQLLRQFGPPDRLSEFTFELPLHAPQATLADLADLWRCYADEPLLVDYPDRLTTPALTEQRLHGFLTGSIDVVLRVPSGGFLIVDYKTNRLDAPGSDPAALTLGHYTRPAMAEAMMASQYPLQALLYGVALHRFLRQRLPDYVPGTHLAGAAYLFVRGMAGAATPVIDGHPTGVFSWRPDPHLVVATSELLAGRKRDD